MEINRFFNAVKNWNDAVGNQPTIAQAKLQEKFLDEELKEYDEAETLADKIDAIIDCMFVLAYQIICYNENNLVCDDDRVLYLTLQRLLFEFCSYQGEFITELCMLVIDANNRKLILDSEGKAIRNEAGKIMKPEGWKPPCYKEVFEKYNHLMKPEVLPQSIGV